VPAWRCAGSPGSRSAANEPPAGEAGRGFGLHPGSGPAISAMKYSRALIKLSGESLAGPSGIGIDPDATTALGAEIVSVHEAGTELGVVVGGGNILRGAVAARQGTDRVSADYMGMLATIINALALQDHLERQGIDTRVMSALRLDQVAEPYIRRRALRHLEKGRIVLFAGGTGNPYFSTDTAAALRAVEMGASVILKATKVDGVYTADPGIDEEAEFIERIGHLDVMARELGVMDAAAISLCKDNGLPVIVLNMNRPGAMLAALRGERVGTLVG